MKTGGGKSKLVAVSLALLSQAACVERSLEVRTGPPGAKIYLDRVYKGTSPLSIAFDAYGVREIEARMAGMETRRERIALYPPWYQIFPLDFLFDAILPLGIRDSRTFFLELSPLPEPPAGGDDERTRGLMDRAEEQAERPIGSLAAR